MNIVSVQFQGNSKCYFYKTPYMHHKGALLIVDVAGKLNVVTVVTMIDVEVTVTGTLKIIVGIVDTLADLEQPTIERKPTLMETLVNHFA